MLASKAAAAALCAAVLADLAGCAHPGAVRFSGFTTEEQKISACLDLQDHIVDLYAREYVESEGVTLSTDELAAFRDGWAEDLAKRGTFDRFERSCFGSLTPRRYSCAMSSQTPWGMAACMRLVSR